MYKWQVKKAIVNDYEKWLDFCKISKRDFCDLDLSKDESYCSSLLKNIKRKTAIIVKDLDSLNEDIVGAMFFSPNQNTISWLAVHPDYRKKGIATSLFEYMLKELSNAKTIKVNTFLYDDEYGKAARAFYKKHGFIEDEIIMELDRYPHPVQVLIKTLNF